MMRLGVAEYASAVQHAAGLGIARAEIHGLYARGGNGGGAHRARLKGDVEAASDQPLGAERGAGGANRQYFGMRRRIAKLAGAVAGARHDLPRRVEQNSADRHLAAPGSGARLAQGAVHMAGKAHALSPALR